MKIKKNDSAKTISIIALVIALVSLTIGYAGLSSQLNINAAAGTVTSSTWDVKFASLASADYTELSISQSDVHTGTGSITGTPSISATQVSNIALNVAAPGDTSYFYWKIVNDGTYNAQTDGITVQTSGELTQEQSTWLAANTTFKIEYLNSNSEWTEITNQTSISIATNATVYVRAALTFSGAATTVPASNISYPTKTVTIPFVAA